MIEREIFDAALGMRDAEARWVFLEQACAGNMPLREQIEGLLRAEQLLDSFLQEPAAVGLGRTMHQAPLERLGTQIGPYKLLQQLGEGGMAKGYMSEQAKPFNAKSRARLSSWNE